MVSRLSGGQASRVSLAVALLGEPELLVLDEPTVGVDPQSRNAILESVARSSDEGMAILYTTHYMEEAERLCDTVTIMSKGAAVATGAPDALVREYAGEHAWEVYGPPDMLEDVERVAREAGRPTRRTGTSVSVLGGDSAPEGYADMARQRTSNLEDVFVAATAKTPGERREPA
mgnify:CR=1 FL=1